jgi:GNAT superfamily N-acetyltransferase
MASRFSVVPLDPGADRSGFECGVELVDRYFKTQVSQDIKRRVTACFTAPDANGRVAGYYTLASASILLTDLAEKLPKKLPRYPNVPAVRMGRLAVDQGYKGLGLGLGGALLADALRRAATAEIAAYAFVVDAKDESAAAFYAHHGFRATLENPWFLYLPLATVKDLVN